jgi:hypothetical protein
MDLKNNIKKLTTFKFKKWQEKLVNIDKRIFIILSSFIIILLLLILVCVFNEKKEDPIPPSKYVLEDELISPKEPLLPDVYLLNRVIGEKWTKEECNSFFTQPNGDVLQQIQLSDDQMIKNILKDTP